MKISTEAEVKIKSVIQNKSVEFPRIVLRKGGCAGNILTLLLEEPVSTDEIIEQDGIKFAVSKDAYPFIQDISIELKKDLGEEIILRNEKAKTCRCRKSFRA